MPCPIYLINLPKDVARAAHMHSQLAALGLLDHLHAIEATYGRDLSPSEMARYYSPDLNARQYHLPLSAGEIGCYVSHLNTWQAIVDSGVPGALVLEDDVVLAACLPTLMAQLMSATEPQWDMIKLVGRGHEKTVATWPLSAPHRVVRYARIPSMTAAYFISRAGAQKLLRRIPFGRPVDIDLRYAWETQLRVYGLLPYPVSLDQSSTVSSIGRRSSPKSWTHRWRRVRQQIAYSLGNWQRLRQERDEAPFLAVGSTGETS
ncbi:glycosyltransferase family 25 protein [Ideonella paludis]|uniref:Glycosyltransferase family 25 protein n=1 Tax=Ideonella paludis TaxID=1233411 RepID=A0ABS5DVR0_9BURK|nr:glycosyltransferase family 25 protein [Ideonella paludis]MBQ0935179.1 glycosyltransferase family 25 protein [Ideonella paludis]